MYIINNKIINGQETEVYHLFVLVSDMLKIHMFT
jgi:hypothetical protein